MINEKISRFKDNMDFELALRNLLGHRYYGYASAFREAKLCKKCLLRAIKRIKRSINQVITTDERLLLTTSIVLERLERYTKEMSTRINNDWLIIANLVYLLSLLLGYDWLDGKIHRHVCYYQTRMQEVEDYQKKVGQAFWDEFPWGDWRIRFEIVYDLKQKHLSDNQTARILGLSEKLVVKILKRIKDFEENTGKKFLDQSSKLSHSFFIV